MAHFWYSQKMDDMDWKLAQYSLGSKYHKRFHGHVLIDETWKRFTVQSETKDHGCKWNDMVYLGESKTFRV